MVIKGLKHINAVWVFIVPVLLTVVVAFFLPMIKTQLNSAKEAEARTALSSVLTALEAYHQEYGTYSDDFEKIGFQPEGNSEFRFYLKTSDVPREIVALLQDSELPFANKEQFRILALKKHGARVRVITLDNTKVFTKRDFGRE